MGLLDDAIREHLELKRRRGADPGEVAREQREALTPVPRDGSDEPDGHDVELVSSPAAVESAPDADAVPAADDRPAVPQPAPGVGAAAAGETAELDMRTVLGEQENVEEHGEAATEQHDVTGDSSEPALVEEDSLEWEVPSEHPAEHVAQEPADPQEAAEDVLEETPEFLRETPEQDRLWFEQRPPRDFDFDK
jgi:hypothetical protein